jgi:hypothetical protein
MSRSLGYAAVGGGVFMALGIVMNLGEGFGALAYVVACFFCVLLPIAVGLRLLRAESPRLLAQRSEQAWQSELMRLAERRGGNLTVAEVVAHAELPAQEAERHLDRLCALGVAEHCVAESGVIVYRFQGLLAGEEKRRARGVLDA